MLQRIAAEKSVDVYSYVMSLRRDRNIMVQVEEQYVFIHDVLLEAIQSGYTEIRANDLRSHIKLLMQVNSVSGKFVLCLGPFCQFVWFCLFLTTENPNRAVFCYYNASQRDDF